MDVTMMPLCLLPHLNPHPGGGLYSMGPYPAIGVVSFSDGIQIAVCLGHGRIYQEMMTDLDELMGSGVGSRDDKEKT